MPQRLPCLLAEPAAASGKLWLTNVRLFDGRGGGVHEHAGVLVAAGRIDRVGAATDAAPEGAVTVDVGGRTLLPGLIDAHAHLITLLPQPAGGAEPLWPGTSAHFLNANLRETLRRGVTTVRDVGSYGDAVVEARQAMRYGAFRGPRVLTCGRIISATSPGGKFFDGMYREADGPDEMRKAVREQLRRGADYVKVMTTGARSVELEDPEPAQITTAEATAIVEEAHRMGYRVAAHCEGLAGTEIAIDAGVDTIEHGMYLHQRPDLLDRMAAAGQVLVPTLSCFYGVAGLGEQVGIDSEGAPPPAPGKAWAEPLVDLAHHNLAEADRTLKAANAAGVPIALGFDWGPLWDAGLELLRLVHHGLSTTEALLAATAGSAAAVGLADRVGTVEPGKLADVVIVDGDPLSDPAALRDRARIWLVLQLGEPVAGAALEAPL